MRLIHALEPFDSSPCIWTELLANPRKKYIYREEKITGELLEKKLLKEDLLRLKVENPESVPASTWGNYCSMSYSNPEEIQKPIFSWYLHPPCSRASFRSQIAIFSGLSEQKCRSACSTPTKTPSIPASLARCKHPDRLRPTLKKSSLSEKRATSHSGSLPKFLP